MNDSVLKNAAREMCNDGTHPTDLQPSEEPRFVKGKSPYDMSKAMIEAGKMPSVRGESTCRHYVRPSSPWRRRRRI